jgi:alcohol dehydrogenase YqhD (iron-dependent ADH family)
MKHVLDAGVEQVRTVRPAGVGRDQSRPQGAALEGIEKTKAFFREIGAPVTLKEVGIGPDRIAEMAKKSVRNGPLGNYKKLEAADVEAIMRASL